MRNFIGSSVIDFGFNSRTPFFHLRLTKLKCVFNCFSSLPSYNPYISSRLHRLTDWNMIKQVSCPQQQLRWLRTFAPLSHFTYPTTPAQQQSISTNLEPEAFPPHRQFASRKNTRPPILITLGCWSVRIDCGCSMFWTVLKARGSVNSKVVCFCTIHHIHYIIHPTSVAWQGLTLIPMRMRWVSESIAFGFKRKKRH